MLYTCKGLKSDELSYLASLGCSNRAKIFKKILEFWINVWEKADIVNNILNLNNLFANS